MSIPSPRYISSTNMNPGKDPEGTGDATRKYLFLAHDEEKQTEENDNDGISSQSKQNPDKSEVPRASPASRNSSPCRPTRPTSLRPPRRPRRATTTTYSQKSGRNIESKSGPKEALNQVSKQVNEGVGATKEEISDIMTTLLKAD